MHYKELECGFEYGDARVFPLTADNKKGWVIITVETSKYKGCEAIEVYVTRTGKVRVFSVDGEWTVRKD
jgi:hypothetical protein